MDAGSARRAARPLRDSLSRLATRRALPPQSASAFLSLTDRHTFLFSRSPSRFAAPRGQETLRGGGRSARASRSQEAAGGRPRVSVKAARSAGPEPGSAKPPASRR